ncbi:MAG: hypothetical protein LC650_00585 [Actinobacteria bacterium]|nr:hypothetical protein [Actinomycetota bacterium]
MKYSVEDGQLTITIDKHEAEVLRWTLTACRGNFIGEDLYQTLCTFLYGPPKKPGGLGSHKKWNSLYHKTEDS